MHSISFAPSVFIQLSIDKPTLRQKLQLSNEQLKAALERESAKDALIAALQRQMSSRDEHTVSLQKIITNLNEQLTQKEAYAAGLELRISLLEQQNNGLAEKTRQQESLITGLQKTIISHEQLIAKQAKQLDKMGMVRHGRWLFAKDRHGIKSERLHEPVVLDPDEIVGGDLTPEERAEAKVAFANGQFARFEEKPHPNIKHQGLPVKTVTLLPKGIDLSQYHQAGQKTTWKAVFNQPSGHMLKIVRPIFISNKMAGDGHHKWAIAPLPQGSMKGIADLSLRKQLLLDKYVYHMPLKRQQEKLERAGMYFPYSTLNEMTNTTISGFKALWLQMQREAVKGKILHCDESGIRVIDKSKPKGKKSHRGFMWVMVNPIQKFAFFRYSPGRGTKDIDDILGQFKGHLHTDAYGVYKQYGKQPGVTHSLCLLHCRRYFIQAKDTAPKLALKYVRLINKLYHNERRGRDEDLDFDQTLEMRQRFAVPVLNEIHAMLKQDKLLVKEHTPIAKAIDYMLRAWDGIMVYTTDGMLQADNLVCERQIKPLALGRVNWLFAGSHEAAPYAAIMYTFFCTCKLQGIDPEEWLHDALLHIQTIPKDRLSELLPQNWKHRREQFKIAQC